MSAAGYSGFDTKIRKTEGFTLIEVIVSIAILSIISVAIVQMFTVSARVNNKAYVLDKANALCTETAERFKADPGFPGAEGSGFTQAPTESGTVYRYLDRDFNYTDGPAPADGSGYRLDVTVTTSSAVATQAFNYPDAAYEYKLTNQETNLTLGSAGPMLAVCINGFEINQGKIIFNDSMSASTGAAVTAGNALIPIRLYWSTSATSSASVNIANEVKTVLNPDNGKEYMVVADIYLCDVPSGVTITVNAVEGVVARQEKPVNTGESQNIIYKAEIKIVKLSDDSVIAENTVKKYWVK
ncbi:MAG TPA: prepilin-type N-terminal cleavage/methylation domain-containing protein [Clostridia bacterium]|nr:prepilin-type N-terminal cleavage/methylation domain-containing protein [Clostridia bacterium]